jgi:FAD/FMN-containing dehydrogenase
MSIADLGPAFRGELIGPADPTYEARRAVNNTRWDRHPAVIARCRGVADVIASLHAARSAELDVAVRSGGHHWAGLSSTDGMLIDLSLMRGVRADPATATARVQGGCLLGDVHVEGARYGLGAVTGLNEAIGMGLILNGGIGHLSPRAGWGSDQILEADIVTADGELVTATAVQNPQLLAGIRGAAPNFGVVTSVVLQLHPVPNPVLAGTYRWVGHDEIRNALTWLADFLASASDGLAMYGSLGATPAQPDLPAHLHGELALRMETCHVGDAAVAAAEIDEIRSATSPDYDTVRPIAFSDLHMITSPAGEPVGTRKASDEEVVTRLTEQVIDNALDHASRMSALDAPEDEVRLVEIYPHRGALTRRPALPSAIATRFPGAWSIMPIAFYSEAARDADHDAWVADVTATARKSDVGTGLTIGNMVSSAPPERMRAVFGTSYDWLAELKRTWDPTNVFRGSLNVLPAPQGDPRA